MAEEKKTSWGDDVSKVIESLGRGLGSILGPGAFSTPVAAQPIAPPPPSKSGKGLVVVGLVAIIAIGGLAFYLTKKNKN